ncbi:MAG: peptidylprolyl isomerase [Gemmatimonadota bacterium]|nr:peptidylprolyl isomerase [Gemmatimonadota bacterium]
MRLGRIGAFGRLAGTRVIAGLLFALAGAIPAPATGLQEGQPVTPPWPADVAEVDRVVAIVGDTAILLSDLRNEMFRLQAQGQVGQIPLEGTPEWDAVAQQVVTALADLVIWLQEAKRAGLSAPDAQVDEVADGYFQQARQGFSSDEELASVIEESGMNMLQYRQMLRSTAETEVLLQTFRQSLASRPDLPPVVVNESEIEEYFQAQVGDQTRPPLISFNQLIVTPYPDGEQADSARGRIARIQIELNEGADFEVVARQYSEDEGSRDVGGELGWMRRDDLVPEFAEAAWRVRAGGITSAQSRFGYHIIKVENSRGGERFLRHILIRPELDDDDFTRANEFAAVMGDSLAAGIDPERLQRARAEVAKDQIRFDNIPIQQLTNQFGTEGAAELSTPDVGRVYGPYEVQRGGPTEYVVVHVLHYRPEGPAELDDWRDMIRRNIRIGKQIDALLAEMRSNTFIDIKL